MEDSTRNLQASAFGNFMEWFDYTLYGFFAVAIGANFFPAEEPLVSTMASYAAFAAGFVARPLGAYYLGRRADRLGRQTVLIQTLLLMGLAVLLVVVAPAYRDAGVVGPVMVVVARLLAGFAAAGETGAAAAMAIEAAPIDKRGRWGGFFTASTYLGVACASAVAMACYAILGTQATHEDGWRIGYAAGLLIVPVGYWVRRGVAHTVSSAPLCQASSALAHRGWATVLCVAGLTAYGSAVFYVVIVFMPVYASKALQIALPSAMTSALLASVLTAGMAVVGGLLSDRWGRRSVMLGGLGLGLGAGWFSFWALLGAPSFTTLACFQWSSAAALGLLAGAALPLMVESFPANRRAWGVGLGYSVGVMLFGALAPLVNTLALHRGIALAPLGYITIGAVVTLTALFALPQNE